MPKTLGSRRKLGNEWTEVLSVEGTSKVKCKYCSTEISNKIERIKVHLKKCGKRLIYSDKSSESSANTTVENMVLTDVGGDSPTCSVAAAMKTWLSDTSKTQRKLSEYIIKTTTSQKEILDQKISKFFYANNVSFLSVESKYFVEMIQALRPGYSAGPPWLVFAFCSDNEAKMKLLKEKMKEDDELKTIISYGCSAHYINLLEQEVTPNSVLKYIIQIQKFFRNHHQPHGWLKEKGGLMPQIPNDTRWNSQQACINTFIQNYYKYVEIANEDKLEMRITNILSNPSLYREAQHLQKQVDVVSKALDKLQSDTATLSIAVNEWLVLLESEVLDPYKANIRKRMEEATEPFFFVANMMDPQYLGMIF
ncbi:hypothetical protein Anas_00532 [Armadillidium nasatum]|uniref:BED-type domain-containing protein n=1 Tax=Armadillidium nasatum TaxID=96803 RepID=A0A5N5T149_9CRUS|nr:hypothetical protein Anas_00532 [Armadillidium nasatum]